MYTQFRFLRAFINLRWFNLGGGYEFRRSGKHFLKNQHLCHKFAPSASLRLATYQGCPDASVRQLRGGLDREGPVERDLLTSPARLSRLMTLHSSGRDRIIHPSLDSLTTKFLPTIYIFSIKELPPLPLLPLLPFILKHHS